MQSSTYFSRRFQLVLWSFASHKEQLVIMKAFSGFLDKRRWRIALLKSAPENIQLSEDLSCQFVCFVFLHFILFFVLIYLF